MSESVESKTKTLGKASEFASVAAQIRKTTKALRKVFASERLKQVPKVKQAFVERDGKLVSLSAPEVFKNAEGVHFLIGAPSVSEVQKETATQPEVDEKETPVPETMSADIETETAPVELDEKDVEMVMEKAGVDREEAESALRKSAGDALDAIILLKETTDV